MRFRFFLSSADAALATLIFELDEPPSPTPPANGPRPFAWHVSFSYSGTGAPQLRPLFAGRLTFEPDPAAPGETPEPEDVEFTSTAYAGWKTRGTLMLSSEKVVPALANMVPPLEVTPNRVWYYPVKISEAFLFTTLRNNLRKADVISGSAKIPTSDPDWAKHAIAGFLKGTYSPELREGATASGDDIELHVMPELPIDAGNVALTITTAFARPPQDAGDEAFEKMSAPPYIWEPAQAKNGIIPAMHVYRTLRTGGNLLQAAHVFGDAVMQDWPYERRYFPLQFTRTWKQIDNVSFHFKDVGVVLTTDGSDPVGAPDVIMVLPSHGTVYFVQHPADPPAPAPVVAVELFNADGSTPTRVTWLDGNQSQAFRVPGAQVPISYDLTLTPFPHIIVRRRMEDELFADVERPNPGGMACTFISMRRSVRALIDLRITGGRLVKEAAKTQGTTGKLVTDALSATALEKLRNGKPDPMGNPSQGGGNLKPVLMAMYPGTAPQTPVGLPGFALPPVTELQVGEVAYHFWQTIHETFENLALGANYPSEHVAHGSAGAAVYLGLAQYVTNPARIGGESDAAYKDRIVLEMRTNLVRGTVLQFWKHLAQYELYKIRQAGEPGIGFLGHSPIFSSYLPPAADGLASGFRIVDQFGEVTDCTVVSVGGSKRIEWFGHVIEFWCGAKWIE